MQAGGGGTDFIPSPPSCAWTLPGPHLAGVPVPEHPTEHLSTLIRQDKRPRRCGRNWLGVAK